MAEHGGDEATVTYRVSELLDMLRREQAAGFAALKEIVAGKADKSDVARIDALIGEHSLHISELQAWRHEEQTAGRVHRSRDERAFTRKQAVVGTLVALLVVIATVVGPVVGALLTGH